MKHREAAMPILKLLLSGAPYGVNCRWKPNTTHQPIKWMIKQGLVATERSPPGDTLHSRRVTLIKLTEKGKKLALQA